MCVCVSPKVHARIPRPYARCGILITLACSCALIMLHHATQDNAARVCRSARLVRLHVILSQRWQVRESNVMRLSPSWFKHERGEMETEEENQFSVLRQRNKEGLSLQRRNSLPHFTAREREKK